MNYIPSKHTRVNMLLLAILNNAIECADEEFLESSFCSRIVEELGINQKPIIPDEIKNQKELFMTLTTKELAIIKGVSCARINEIRRKYGWQKKKRTNKSNLLPLRTTAPILQLNARNN